MRLPKRTVATAVAMATVLVMVSACGAGTDVRVRDLSDAAGDGDTARVRELLEGGVDPNERWWDIPPLHIAAANGHLDIVVLLYQGGADPEALSSRGDTALASVAVGESNLETAEWVLDRVNPCVPLSEYMRDTFEVGSMAELALTRGKPEVAALILNRQAVQGC